MLIMVYCKWIIVSFSAKFMTANLLNTDLLTGYQKYWEIMWNFQGGVTLCNKKGGIMCKVKEFFYRRFQVESYVMFPSQTALN